MSSGGIAALDQQLVAVNFGAQTQSMNVGHENWKLIAVVAIFFSAFALGFGAGLPDPNRAEILLEGVELPPEAKSRLTTQRSSYFIELHAGQTKVGQELLSGKSDFRDLKPDIDVFSQNAEFTFDDKLVLLRSYLLHSPRGDESVSYSALSHIRPEKFEFDPHFYNYGGAFLYPLGGVIFALDQLSVINITSNIEFYLDHAIEINKLFLTGRTLNILAFLGILVVLWRVGVEFFGFRVGILAAIAFGLSSLPWYLAISARPHVFSAFWATLALFFLLRFIRDMNVRTYILSIGAMGIAMGSFLPTGLAAIAYPLLLWGHVGTRRWIGLSLVGGISVATIYAATNPYAILNLPEFYANFMFHAASDRYDRAVFNLVKFSEFLPNIIYGLAFPTSVIGFVAMVWALLFQTGVVRRLALFVLLAFVIAGGTVATSRVVVFLGPLICLFGAVGLDRACSSRFLRSTRAQVVFVALGLLPGFLSIAIYSTDAILGERAQDPFRQWVTAESFTNETVIGVMGPPGPHYIPPFPIFRTRVVDILKITDPSEITIDFVLLRKGDQPSWEVHPIRPQFELVVDSGLQPVPNWMRMVGILPWRDHTFPVLTQVYKSRSSLSSAASVQLGESVQRKANLEG